MVVKLAQSFWKYNFGNYVSRTLEVELKKFLLGGKYTSRPVPINTYNWDFPGGAVVKNPPANAADMGSSPGRGRSHMPRSN